MAMAMNSYKLSATARFLRPAATLKLGVRLGTVRYQSSAAFRVPMVENEVNVSPSSLAKALDWTDGRV